MPHHRLAWRPLRASQSFGRPLVAGDIFAADHRAWRVIELRPHLVPEDAPANAGPSYEVACVPIIVNAEPGPEHGMIVNTTMPAPRLGGLNPDPTAKPIWPSFWILDKHYPACGRCGEPSPCREVTDDKRTVAAVDEFKRYENPELCPACSEPITLRQQSLTLPNIINPLGGQVTFHLRSRCYGTAEEYERRALAAGAVGRSVLSCEGSAVEHLDRSFECSSPICPGAQARHREWAMCTKVTRNGCPRDCTAV